MSSDWWLISRQDVNRVCGALEHAHGIAEPDLKGVYSDALHTLDSGLHTTECVPHDFQGMPKVCAWRKDGEDWEPRCNEELVWIFDEGGPAENEVTYCPFCGLEVLVVE